MEANLRGFSQMAQREWFKRPDDERFHDLETLRAAAEADTIASREFNVYNRRALSVVADGDDLRIQAPTAEGTMLAKFSNWSFGQTAKLAGAPAAYLSSLPAPLAADCLNHGLQTAEAEPAVLYVRQGNGADAAPTVRAMTSNRYARVQNLALIDGLIALQSQGWSLPPDWSLKPSGLFYSDRSMFAYMIDDATRSIVTHPEATRREDLARGFFLWNSEEGAASFGLCAFLFRYTCGNLGVWGVGAYTEIRLRHVGDTARARIRGAMRHAATLSADSASQDLDAVRWALGEKLVAGALPYREAEQVKVLAEAVKDRSRGAITEGLAARAITKGMEEGENVRNVWGIVQGFTALARDTAHRDRADDLMRAPLALMPAQFRQRSKVVTI